MAMARRPSEAEIAYFEMLLGRHLSFYRSLHRGARKPMTQKQREFVDVARGLRSARTLHEKAYMHHLATTGIKIDRNPPKLPASLRSGPNETGKKWSDAAENMARWRPWHD